MNKDEIVMHKISDVMDLQKAINVLKEMIECYDNYVPIDEDADPKDQDISYGVIVIKEIIKDLNSIKYITGSGGMNILRNICLFIKSKENIEGRLPGDGEHEFSEDEIMKLEEHIRIHQDDDVPLKSRDQIFL